jgi:hypothetical protein
MHGKYYNIFDSKYIMIHYMLTKVGKAIDHLLEAERAFNQLDTCGILDYDITYHRCLVQCFAAFEVLVEQIIDSPEIETELFKAFLNNRKQQSGHLFAYLNEARNSYLHHQQGCLWVDSRDKPTVGLGQKEHVGHGVSAGVSRFGKCIGILQTFEFSAGGFVALRPVALKPRKKEKEVRYLNVPLIIGNQDLSLATPRRLIEVLLDEVGKIVCEAHHATDVNT